MLVVSDTSPIANLLLANHLDLLRDLFEQVVVPPKVDAEIRRLAELGEDISVYEASLWIKIAVPSSSAQVARFSESLDAGESEAIALALELRCDFLLIDERKGTQIARAEGLQTIGLLGVLAKAKQKRLIRAVKPLLDHMEEVAGFWLGRKLKEDFLRDVGEQ